MEDLTSKVQSICDDSQEKSNISQCIDKLKLLLQNKSEDKETILLNLFYCYDQVLVCVKKEQAAENVLTFFSKYFSNSPDDIFRSGIEYLLWRSQSLDKTVRYRSLQTIASILAYMSKDIERASDLLEAILSVLLPRLKDKAPNVRLWAIKALTKFQNAQDDKDPVIIEFIRLMTTDSSKEIRIAALNAIEISNLSLPPVFSRIKDIRPEVRISAYTKLIDFSHKQQEIKKVSGALCFKSNLRIQVIQYGLRERDENVKKAAIKLIFKWLEGLEYNVPKLLHLFGLNEFEEEIEIIGLTIIDEIENTDIIPSSIKKRIQEHRPEWEDGLDALPPGEILWVYLRCHYAKNNFSQAVYEDIVENLVPDIVKLCELLKKAHKVVPPSGYGTGTTVLQIKYLFRLTRNVDTSDVFGTQEIQTICKSMIKDIRLNDFLVEHVLDAWIQVVDSSFGSIVVENIETITTPSESDNEEDEALKIFRAMQMIAWMLTKYSNGNKNLPQDAEDFIQTTLPMIFDSIQTPLAELREIAIRCLGLSCLAQESACLANKEIIMQVIQTEEEEDIVRGQALQSVFDMSLVYPEKFSQDQAFMNLLLRILESENAFLVNIAAEGVAKLIFSGVISDSRLFAKILMCFLIPKNPDTEEDIEGGSLTPINTIGSSSHMQQILSVFFHAFFKVGNDGRETIALEAILDLVSELSSLIRFEGLNPNTFSNVLNKFMSLFTSVPNETIQAQVHQYLFAAISREILKLGTSSVDKNAGKEYVKALGMLNLSTWVSSNLAPTLHKLLGVLFKSTSDKNSLKILEKLSDECQVPEDSNVTNETIEENASKFYMIAPGLADLIEMGSSPSDDMIDLCHKVKDNLGITNNIGMVKPKLLPKTPSKINSDAGSDQKGDYDDIKKIVRPGRSTKVAAQKKIADQIAKENNILY